MKISNDILDDDTSKTKKTSKKSFSKNDLLPDDCYVTFTRVFERRDNELVHKKVKRRRILAILSSPNKDNIKRQGKGITPMYRKATLVFAKIEDIWKMQIYIFVLTYVSTISWGYKYPQTPINP